MGAIITYASYLKGQKLNLPRQATVIGLSDMSVALVGGLVTFPIIYHFGLQGDVSESSVGALFIALPRAFGSMGSGGVIVGTVFFLALYIAAITSAISLLEVVVSGAIDAWGWTRHRAALTAGALVALAGVPSASSLDWLGFLDKTVGEFFLVVGGMLIALLTGWILSEKADGELAEGFPHDGMRHTWIWLLRVVVPLILAVVAYFTFRQVIPLAGALFS
jgi:NSS family neurotransmitter:Na+ symporter